MIQIKFNEPKLKRWVVRLVSAIKHLPHKVFFIATPSAERWPTNTNKVPSPHEVMLTCWTPSQFFNVTQTKFLLKQCLLKLFFCCNNQILIIFFTIKFYFNVILKSEISIQQKIILY